MHQGGYSVWYLSGCFSHLGVDILKRIKGNINSAIYQDLLVNDIDLIAKCLVFPLQRFIFQHDNVSCDRSALAVSLLTDHNISLLDFPANYPDANPTEILWRIIKNKVNTLGSLNVEQLW